MNCSGETLCTDLYPAVAPVCYYDVSIDVHCYPRGGIELAVALTIRSKLQQEFSFCVEDLQEKKVTDYFRFDKTRKTSSSSSSSPRGQKY